MITKARTFPRNPFTYSLAHLLAAAITASAITFSLVNTPHKDCLEDEVLAPMWKDHNDTILWQCVPLDNLFPHDTNSRPEFYDLPPTPVVVSG